MKNSRYLVAGVGIGALLWMALKPSKIDMKNLYETAKNKLPIGNKGIEPLIAKVGNSDPMDIDDNKMVSEGAQYGVHYYNQTEQDDA